MQSNDYYAFGYTIQSLQSAISLKNEYLYNGKELQEESGLYDYGARLYDPAVGCWIGLDPLAETSRRFNPYAYGNNNPLKFIDPDGMQVGWYDKSSASWGMGMDQTGNSNTETKFIQYDPNNVLLHATIAQVFAFLNGENVFGDANTTDGDLSEDDKNGPKPKPKANQGGLSLDQELAKYGQIKSYFSGSINVSVAGIGYESGTLMTDKGWARDYVTVLGHVGWNISITINGGRISPKGNAKPTFSDWEGLSMTYGGGIWMIGVSKTVGSTYTAWNGSFGESWGYKGFGKSVEALSASKTESRTWFTSDPYIPGANFQNSYIKTQNFLGGGIKLDMMEVSFKVRSTKVVDKAKVIENITRKLQLDNYKILSSSDNNLTFRYGNIDSIIASRMETFSVIDKGKISTTDQNGYITLTYSMQFLAEVIVVVLSLLAGFIWDEMLCIVSTVVAAQLAIRILLVRRTALDLLASASSNN